MKKIHINNSADAERVLRPLFSRPEQEELVMMTVNGRNEAIGYDVVAVGTDIDCPFPVKIICRKAVLDVAHGVIVAHSHPSGNPVPSAADVRQTERLKKALALFDISLMDHIVIAGEKSWSFAER